MISEDVKEQNVIDIGVPWGFQVRWEERGKIEKDGKNFYKRCSKIVGYEECDFYT